MRDSPPKASGGYILFLSPSHMNVPCQTRPCVAFRLFVRWKGWVAWCRCLDLRAQCSQLQSGRVLSCPPAAPSEGGAVGRRAADSCCPCFRLAPHPRCSAT